MDFWILKEPSDEFKFHAKMREIAEWLGLEYLEDGRFRGFLFFGRQGKADRLSCRLLPPNQLVLEYSPTSGIVSSGIYSFGNETANIAKSIADVLLPSIASGVALRK